MITGGVSTGRLRPGAAVRWARLALGVVALLLSLAGPTMAQNGAAGGAPRAVSADLAARNVAVITLREEITSVTKRSIERRIREATSAGADLLVFDIDSPGGELYAALGICSDIKQAGVRTMAWVNTRAFSGGALVALACDRIVVSDPASMGDIKPVTIGLEGPKPLTRGQLEKVLPPLLAEVIDSAQRNNRELGRYVYDEQLLQAMVVSDAELWLVRDKQTGLTLTVTRPEFEMLFPGEPTDQTPRLASLGGRRAAEPEAPAQGQGVKPSDRAAAPVLARGQRPDEIRPIVPDGSPAEGWNPVMPASPTASSVGPSLAMNLSVPSMRPVIRAEDRGRYELVQKVSDGTGPLVLTAEDMRFFGLASNVDASGALAPVKSDADLKALAGATSLVRLDPSWSEGLVFFLTNPIVRGVLIVVFLLSLFLEMAHPGLILPGGVAAMALIALLAPPMLIGMANWWEIAAIASGVLLIALELFVLPGFGVAGIVGLLLLFGGLVGTFVPGADQMFPGQNSAGRDASMGALTVFLSAVTAGIGIYFITKNFGSLPVLNRLILRDAEVAETAPAESMLAAMGPGAFAVSAGMEGVAATPLRPAGKMRVQDQEIDVVCELGFVPAGSRVRVVHVSPFRVAVEEVREPRGPEAGPASQGSA